MRPSSSLPIERAKPQRRRSRSHDTGYPGYRISSELTPSPTCCRHSAGAPRSRATEGSTLYGSSASSRPVPESPATSRQSRKPCIEQAESSKPCIEQAHRSETLHRAGQFLKALRRAGSHENSASSKSSIVLFPIPPTVNSEVCEFKEATKQDVYWKLRSRLQGKLCFRGSS